MSLQENGNSNSSRPIQGFEDIIAWQKARVFVKDIYQATQTGRFASDHGLSRQIQRAAVSVMSNIAEGYERENRAEFNHYLRISKASCAEVLSQLYVAMDIGYLDSTTFMRLSTSAREINRIIAGLRATNERQLKNQKKP